MPLLDRTADVKTVVALQIIIAAACLNLQNVIVPTSVDRLRMMREIWKNQHILTMLSHLMVVISSKINSLKPSNLSAPITGDRVRGSLSG